MNFETLIQNLQVTHDTFLDSAAKALNTAMTVRNWLNGYYIVEYKQKGVDDRIIQATPEQFPVNFDDTIRQTVSDELKSINILDQTM